MRSRLTRLVSVTNPHWALEEDAALWDWQPKKGSLHNLDLWSFVHRDLTGVARPNSSHQPFMENLVTTSWLTYTVKCFPNGTLLWNQFLSFVCPKTDGQPKTFWFWNIKWKRHWVLLVVAYLLVTSIRTSSQNVLHNTLTNTPINWKRKLPLQPHVSRSQIRG